ncbi:MAG: lysophospholipid acyltransferase family protein [SAR324 cluster bacterium]|nr:lysophospholipid acyltransferase family protein [SAR324 cluster bacterium]
MTSPSGAPEYSRFSRLKVKPFQALRRELQYRVVWLFQILAGILSVSASQRMGRWTGRLLYPLVWREREICDYQLQLAFPDLDQAGRRRLALASFENLGMTLWENLATPRIRKQLEGWLHVENEQALREAHAEGKGVILITGHIGNWELVCRAADLLRLPLHVVVRGIVNTRLNDFVVRNRLSEFVQVVERGTAQTARQLLKCLKQGDVLVVAIDHDVDVSSVFVDFFGIPANTPRVAASLALRNGVPVVAGFDRRRTDGSHQFSFKRLPPPKNAGNDAEGVRRYTQFMIDAIEAHIRACPEQWTWNHRRWKRRPGEGKPAQEAAR